MENPKFRIAVCGGGIGGLTLAVAVAKYPDIEVDIYEAAEKFSAIGAGIGIWPRIWDILSTIGLGSLATKTSTAPGRREVHAFTFRKSDQTDGLTFYNLITQGPYLTFHRADFQQKLIEHLPTSTRIHFSKRFKSYKWITSDQLSLSFEDGSTTTCNILVGADGINSAVRRCFIQEYAQSVAASGHVKEAEDLFASISPTWTGSIAYRALIPAERLEQFPVITVPKFPIQYLGKNAHLIVYPVAGGRFVNFVAFRANYELAKTVFDGPWVSESSVDELSTAFDKWEPEVQAWLKCVEKPTKWAIHTSMPLFSFASNNVVILGDAAHAMSPHQGSGAGQAIEDAYVLATLLGHNQTTIKTLPKVLGIYDALRRPFTMDVARRSSLNGRFFTFNHEDFDISNTCDAEQKKRLKEMGDAIVENWRWTWSTSVDEMIAEGIGRLESVKAHL